MPPPQARVYLRYQAVVVRPLVYPIRVTLGSPDLPVKRNLHSSDQLPHVNLHFRLSASTVTVAATPPLATISIATASTGAERHCVRSGRPSRLLAQLAACVASAVRAAARRASVRWLRCDIWCRASVIKLCP